MHFKNRISVTTKYTKIVTKIGNVYLNSVEFGAIKFKKHRSTQADGCVENEDPKTKTEDHVV